MEQREDRKDKKEADDQIVFIGNKDFMNYISAVMLQFTIKKSKEIVIKARGRFTSRAIDVAEASKRLLGKDKLKIEVKDIKIASENIENKEGKKVNVSIIEITLTAK